MKKTWRHPLPVHRFRGILRSLISETHKGLKRVTRVQCLWIFILTIFGNEFLVIYNPRHKSWNTCVIFPSPMLIWVCRHFSAPKYDRLNIGEGEGHIWVRIKVWRVNVRNLEKIQNKWLLIQRFVTSILVHTMSRKPVHWELQFFSLECQPAVCNL